MRTILLIRVKSRQKCGILRDKCDKNEVNDKEMAEITEKGAKNPRKREF